MHFASDSVRQVTGEENSIFGLYTQLNAVYACQGVSDDVNIFFPMALAVAFICLYSVSQVPFGVILTPSVRWRSQGVSRGIVASLAFLPDVNEISIPSSLLMIKLGVPSFHSLFIRYQKHLFRASFPPEKITSVPSFVPAFSCPVPQVMFLVLVHYTSMSLPLMCHLHSRRRFVLM